jgi:hypothetical protein
VKTDQWLNTPEFLAVWKDAFHDTKSTFVHLSENVQASSKREKTGGLWTLINHPLPGIHLLAIELQPDVSPLSIRLKVWINQDYPSIYDKLLRAPVPVLLGKPTVLSPDQKPRPNWERQIKEKKFSLRGLSYRLSNLSFINDKTTAGVNLQRMGTEFSVWLVNTITTDELPSTSSETTSEASEEDRNFPFAVDAIYPDEVQPSDQQYPEGATTLVMVNAYERNARARQACIDHYGFDCVVCGLNFEERYGDEIGRGFIHIHHELPLHEIGREYLVNPVEHLKPVCPNCHVMLHRLDPPLSIPELRARLKRI